MAFHLRMPLFSLGTQRPAGEQPSAAGDAVPRAAESPSPCCAACSAELSVGASFCEACGAVVCTQPLRLPAQGHDAGTGRPHSWRLRAGWLAAALAAAAVAAGVAAAIWRAPMPEVSSQALREVLERSEALSRDPLCVANGLAYDAAPVHVQPGDAATLSWMDTLAAAGLYEREPAAGGGPAALRTYVPGPDLAAWGGARRLCIASGLQLAFVRSLGAVGPMRVRGQTYPGVAAEVVWSLDGPAPWLALPGVAGTFANELPAWRGGRWQVGPQGWRLTQRRHFYLHRGEWLTVDLLERRAGLPPRDQP